MAKLTFEEVDNLVRIGFCQPKFYKRSVWLKAKKIMDSLCEMNIGVIPYDYGRGKGKYTTQDNLSISDVSNIYYSSDKNK